MILIISNKLDLSIDFVTRELNRRNVQFLRINSEDLPFSSWSVYFPEFRFEIPLGDGNQYNIGSEVKSVLLRRPGKPFEWQEEVDEEVASFCVNQWSAFLRGLSALSNVRWINDPTADSKASNKILQLKVASDLGFNIPSTCISSNPVACREFVDEDCSGTAIAKALDTPLIERPDGDYFIYSNFVGSLNDVADTEISACPTIYQKFIEEKTDVRVTVVGTKLFAVRIVRKSGQALEGDWRTESNLEFLPYELPSDVSELCIEYVRKLGLVFGAIDLLKKGSQFYFLEINPCGEWGWLQASGIPIAEAIVEELVAS